MDGVNESYQKPLLFLRLICVYLFLLLLLVLNASNLPLFDLDSATPFFLLMGIYYWSLMRPEFLPLPLVLTLGLLLDFISGLPVGLNAFCFLVIVFILNSQRRFLSGQPWTMLWVGFALASLLVSLIHFLVFAIINWTWPGALPLLISVLISALAYPLCVWPMAALNRSLSERRK